LNLIATKLRTAGSTVEDEELITKIMCELPGRYESSKSRYRLTMASHNEEPILEEFLKLLTDFEKMVAAKSLLFTQFNVKNSIRS
jgi:hypothetical protein